LEVREKPVPVRKYTRRRIPSLGVLKQPMRQIG
jgi:hypothetical protein